MLRIATKNTTQQQSPRRTERAGAGGLGLGGWGLQDAAGALPEFPPSCGCAPVAGAMGRGAAANERYGSPLRLLIDGIHAESGK